MKQVSLCLALIVAFVNAASAQVVDATQVGNSVMINLNYQSLDSIIRALESRIESLEGTQDLDGDGVRSNQDCDDDDAAVGAETMWYFDEDGDGYGGDNTMLSCTQPQGYVSASGDCDDGDDTINPEATDICGSGIDQNCDNVFPSDPVVSGVSISPSIVYANTDLSVSETITSPGETITPTYLWTVNGAVVATSSSLSSAYVNRSDIVEVTVTATNSAGCSDSAADDVVVANSSPTAPGVTIVGTPMEGETLTATISTASSDPDGDALTYEYAWSVDGSPTSCNTATYCLSMTYDQTISVTVTAYDGVDWGPPASASVVIIPPP